MGDCVESFHRIAGRSVVVALGTHANKQGRAAGTHIAGGDAAFAGVLGAAITKFRNVEIGRTGLTEGEARAAGFDAVSVPTEASSRAHYFPGAQPMQIKIVAERRTGRLLGAQIVGGDSAGKRIDVLATALWNNMAVGGGGRYGGGMDLSYAPPFSPVWDVKFRADQLSDPTCASSRTAAKRTPGRTCGRLSVARRPKPAVCERLTWPFRHLAAQPSPCEAIRPPALVDRAPGNIVSLVKPFGRDSIDAPDFAPAGLAGSSSSKQ